ncbi:MAG: thiamine pyrophosphokinase1, partial [Trebouxia sp. A1-2]
APVCSVAAGSSSLILPSSCHRLTRNRTLRIRVTLTVTSITCMSSREVENKLSSQSDASHSKLIALILNYNLPTQVHKLLHKAQFCICADGGANQLYDAAPRFAQHLSAVEARQLVRPAVIVGDLDSIKDEVRQFYAQLGTEIKDLSSDQNTTDLQKCLTELEHRFSTQELADMTIVVAGGLGGRLDHTMSALSTLHKWPHLHLVLWGDGSMAQLLAPGKHVIRPAKEFEGPTCGLVPLSGPARISTQGLKWDLGKTPRDLQRLQVG